MKSSGPVVQNYGGTYQLRIQTADDLKTILDLDEARWVATSAPVDGLECDRAFLDYVDTDGNGRVRTDEVRTAISWLLQMLSDTSGLADKADTLPLASVDTSHKAGEMLRRGAERVLRTLGRDGADEIALSDVRDRQTLLANAAANGDGVIPPEACGQDELAQFIRDILDTVGGRADASGQTGIGMDDLNAFLEEAKAYLEWAADGMIPDGKKRTGVMVWGEDTPAAFAAMEAVRDKLDEYFSLCDLVRFDPKLTSAVGLSEEDIQRLDYSNSAAMETEIKKIPLSGVNKDGVLDFGGVINPYYTSVLAAFREKAASLAMGEGPKLDAKVWGNIKMVLEPYGTWTEAKKGGRAEKLGEVKLRNYLSGDFPDRMKVVIEADAAVAGEVAEVAGIEKLILYRKWMMVMVNNMVSMPHLYDPRTRALFEMGSLVIDGRQFEFNVKVKDRAQHKKTAESSGTFLMYVEVTGKDADERLEVATPVTSGEAGNLVIDKRGIFFSTDGREWDARIVDVIRKPISLSEAIKAPFISIGSLIGRQIEKITASRSADLDAGIQKQMAAAQKPPTQAAAQKAPASGAMMLMGGGAVLAMLGSAFALITKMLASVKIIQVLGVVVVAVGAVLVPIIILGIVRLRRRDIAHILEASGWAVNARLRITADLGRLLTFRPSFPAGTVRERADLVKFLAKQTGRQRGRLRWVLGAVCAGVVGSIIGYVLGQWFLP